MWRGRQKVWDNRGGVSMMMCDRVCWVVGFTDTGARPKTRTLQQPAAPTPTAPHPCCSAAATSGPHALAATDAPPPPSLSGPAPAGGELSAAIASWQERHQLAAVLSTGFLDGSHPIVDAYELGVRLQHMLRRLTALAAGALVQVRGGGRVTVSVCVCVCVAVSVAV